MSRTENRGAVPPKKQSYAYCGKIRLSSRIAPAGSAVGRSGARLSKSFGMKRRGTVIS
jgi:hypothetical protein